MKTPFDRGRQQGYETLRGDLRKFLDESIAGLKKRLDEEMTRPAFHPNKLDPYHLGVIAGAITASQTMVLVLENGKADAGHGQVSIHTH